MIKIFLADDHVVVRHGLRRLIEDTDDLELVGETSRATQVGSLRLRIIGDSVGTNDG